MAVTSKKVLYKALPPDFWVVDCAPILTGYDDLLGVWLFTSAIGNRSVSQGAVVYMSRDGGTTYHELATSANNANNGWLMFTDTELDRALATTGAELMNGRDNYSRMLIEWNDGYQPASVTEAELMNGRNLVLVGEEIMQYKTVVSNTPPRVGGHWELLRGRRGTEGNIAGVSQGDIVLEIDSRTTTFAPLTLADVGKELKFKCAVDGMDMDDSNVVTMTFNGNSLKPFAPSNVTGTRNATGDITFNWNRRTRSQVRLMGVKRLPYGEDVDEYEVDILTSAQPYTVLRTITTSTTSATYLASEMTDDGLTVGNAINFRVHQMSNAVGRGHANDLRVLAGSTPNWKQQTEFI